MALCIAASSGSIIHPVTGSSTPNGYCVAVAVLRHGRDVLLTKDKSITGNVALRFWVLVPGRSRDERLLSF